ncbi:collagenase-like [Ostrinia furnacalis]|uniref:collagenase-like n=1 Tax=Ostrinia furnacalis TaxID=93504 RepID=UPI00103A942D|nr:collagenase-like [Ostrinia furnacalis]
MSWKLVFVVALAVTQVPARPDVAQLAEPSYVENVRSNDGSRIVSGWEAYPGQHPHHVSLRMVNPDGAAFSCGGSLVAKNWVISAAHCTAGRASILVRAGVVDVSHPEFTSETTEWYNYPTFVEEMPQFVQPNDISLVKMQDSVTYTRLTQRIRIQPGVDAFRNYEGLVVIASGHGRTWTDGSTSQNLNWVYLRTISNDACAGTFGNSLINNNAICARYFNVTSQSTCQGDSGGPLVHTDVDGVPTLIGVASFVAGGSFGCHSGLPGGFIRPGPFHDWFTQISGLDFDNLVEEDDVTEPPPTEPPAISTEVPTTTTQAPTTTTTQAPPKPDTEEPENETEAPESEEDTNEDSNEESGDSDSSEDDEDDDPELKDLLKRLEVLVKVKVKMSKYGNKHKHEIKHKHNKSISHRH